MAKKCLGALLATAIVLFAGCSVSEPANSVPIVPASSVSQSADSSMEGSAAPISLRLLSKGGNGAIGVSTSNGYYELTTIGDTASNILYTDFATHSRIFLCNRPDCKHQDESCTSFVEGWGSLFLMNDKLCMIHYGNTDITAPDAERMTRVYSMNYDGSQRTELFAMDPSLTVFGGMVTDEENLYFMGIILDTKDPDKQTPALIKVDFSTGAYTALQEYSYPPYIGGVMENCLILEDAYEKNGEFIFQYSTLSIPDCTQTVFFESPIQCTVQDNQVYQLDVAQRVIHVISPKTGEATSWPLDMDVSETDYIQGGSHEVQLPGYTSFSASSPDSDTDKKYLIELATGKTAPVRLTYTWYDGREKPIYILAVPNEDTLLVINRCELTQMNYLSEGSMITHDMLRSYYAFLPFDDYLNSVPNYTPVDDMLGELFLK